MAGSASRSTLRTEGASEAGSSGVRTTRAKPRCRSENGKKMSGSLVGLLGSAAILHLVDHADDGLPGILRLGAARA